MYESSEEELVEFLRSLNLSAQRITADESNMIAQQVAERDFTMWCAEGSLVTRQGSSTISLQPGDAVLVSANLPYDLLAGIAGYVCYVTW